MRPLLTIALFLSLLPCHAQFFLSYRDVESMQNTPRFSWTVPLYYTLIFKDGHHVRTEMFQSWQTNKPFFTLGCEIQNNGVIFKDTGFTHKYSGISAGPNLSLTKQFFNYQNKEGKPESKFHVLDHFKISYGVNFCFYNKEKIFESSSRKHFLFNREFTGKRFVSPDQYIRISTGSKDFYSFFAEYHFQSFFNRSYQRNMNGTITNPFYDYRVSRINAGVKFDIVYITVATAGVLILINSFFK